MKISVGEITNVKYYLMPASPRLSSRNNFTKNIVRTLKCPIVGQSRIAVIVDGMTRPKESIRQRKKHRSRTSVASTKKKKKRTGNATKDPTSKVSSRNSRGPRSRESFERLEPSVSDGHRFHDKRGNTISSGHTGGVFTHPELPAAAVVQLQEVSLDSGTSLSGAAYNSVPRWRLPGNGDAVVLGATLFGDQ